MAFKQQLGGKTLTTSLNTSYIIKILHICNPYWLYYFVEWKIYILFNQILSSFEPAFLCLERNYCRFVPSTPNTMSGCYTRLPKRLHPLTLGIGL